MTGPSVTSLAGLEVVKFAAKLKSMGYTEDCRLVTSLCLKWLLTYLASPARKDI